MFGAGGQALVRLVGVLMVNQDLVLRLRFSSVLVAGLGDLCSFVELYVNRVLCILHFSVGLLALFLGDLVTSALKFCPVWRKPDVSHLRMLLCSLEGLLFANIVRPLRAHGR